MCGRPSRSSATRNRSLTWTGSPSKLHHGYDDDDKEGVSVMVCVGSTKLLKQHRFLRY